MASVSLVVIIQFSALFFVIFIQLVLAGLFFLKYIKFKMRELLFLGFILSIWALLIYTPFFISFLMVLFTGVGLNKAIYAFTISSVPIMLFFWVVVLTDLLWPYKKKPIIIFTLIGVIITLSIHYCLVFVLGPSELVILLGDNISAAYHPYITAYIAISLLIILITSLLLAIRILKEKAGDLRLKGKFLMIAFIFLVLGTVFESVYPLPGVLYIITRIFQIIAFISLYIGFTLPNAVRKLFLKESKSTQD